jgi:CheY-like chemotaxis protein
VAKVPTVLIADDTDSVRALIVAALQGGDYELLEATDGTTALALVRWHHPDLAILDILMPGLNGIDLARAIRGDPDLAGTRIIILSAVESDPKTVVRDIAGADLYLPKPFSPRELRRAVERLLGPGAIDPPPGV